MGTSRKEWKNEFLEKWSLLKRYSVHPTYGKIATMLIDAHPLVVSNDVCVLELPLPSLSEKANLQVNQKDLQTVIHHIFNKHLFVYAISRKESVDYQQAFRNRKFLKLIPKAEDIHIDFEVIKL